MVKQERHEDAVKVLRRLHGARGEDFVQRQYVEIRDQLALEADLRRQSSLKILFTRQYARRMLLACLIVNMTKLSGSQVIQKYQSLMYAALGFKGQTVLLIAGCYGTMGILGQIFNLIWVSDTWSRRKTMCTSCGKSDSKM